jgi:Uri superfamily endonuclease
MENKGTYSLVTRLEQKKRLRIGKLGIMNFPTGYYVYIGSAHGGLPSRLSYHFKLGKRNHWHIDYLLKHAKVFQIWYAIGREKLECDWNKIIGSLPGAINFTSGFGSSDCQCSSHLVYFKVTPSFNLFKQELLSNKHQRVFRLNEVEFGFNDNNYFSSIIKEGPSWI